MIRQTNFLAKLATDFPKTCYIISKGLRDNYILPSGGGKYGELFGSYLISPTLHFYASDFGSTCKSNRINISSSLNFYYWSLF